MKARHDIEKFLGRWFELTQAEAGAIQTSEWTELREIQSAKAELQKSLTAARERLMAEDGNGSLAPKNTDPLRLELGRLASLESRNEAMLAAQMRQARVEQEKRSESLRNLRRLQRSYGRRLDAAWQSYS